MLVKSFLALLICGGFFKILGVSIKIKLPKISLKHRSKKEKKKTVKDVVLELEGRDKRSYLQKNQDDARIALSKTGQSGKYRKTVLFARILGFTGFASSLIILQNILLAPVLAVGLYFVPLWATRLYIYTYDRFISDELETALSLITTSYTRHSDLQKAIEENINHINKPVKTAFNQYLQNLKFVNSNTIVELERLRNSIDNSIFRKWCDAMILCQSNHTLKSTLIPIVSKFSDIKAQQAENETNMMLPLRDASIMVGIVVLCVPFLAVINTEWYQNLVYTLWGQIAMAVSAIVVFVTINKAILLCEPIEYEI